MDLKLNNPIVVFDIEATGLNISFDRIVEISIIKIFPGGKEETRTRRINPEIPIPVEASAIHGITDDDVKDCPTFKQIAKSLAEFIKDSDLAGYNLFKFDIPLLVEEFLRAEISIDFRRKKIIDVQNIFHKMEQRTLAAAYRFYCNKALENAHSAYADAKATYEILQAQLDVYSELKNEVKFLSEFSTYTKNIDYAGRFIMQNGEPLFNFGKYKGQKIKDILIKEPSYYNWMMNGDFTLDTKRALTEIRLSMMLK
ncbi:MAG: 3'-5' exonuclease [Prevotellaceae bacterium]|jgi:DNA polymerase-3 subunit epsilon|nr:3'-5' exonuclease [Prevotellaceae bacterium]